MSDKNSQSAAVVAKPVRILFAVGDQQTLTYLGSLLSKIPGKPYHMLRTKTLEQTVQAMAKGLCDVVLLNYFWGKTRVGDKVLEWVRLKKVTIPVVVLTRDNHTDIDRSAVLQGAADYLVLRDLNQQSLDRAIRYALERAKTAPAPPSVTNHHHYYDYLTNLPNRLLFQNRLQHAVHAAKAGGGQLALSILDLKGLKEINALYGNEAGDNLLQQVAAMINQVVGNSVIVARIGGDEFAMLQVNIQGPEQPRRLAEKLLAKLSTKMTIGQHQLVAQCYIGIVVYPDMAGNIHELYNRAYCALTNAKQSDSSSYQLYSVDLLPANLQTVTPEKQFIDALANNQIGLYFNPRIHATTQEIIAIEVNPYWAHPQKGLLEYEQFLWNGLSNDIATRFTEWLLGTSFEYFNQLSIANATRLVFNIEFKGLFSTDLPRIVEKYSQNYHIDPSRLEFDLSKVAIEQHSYMLQNCMERLHDMGVTFGINHFGSDEMSLTYLKDLPVSIFKLSKEFLTDIGKEGDGTRLVRALVGFAHSLGKDIVIEGLHSQLPVSDIHRLGFDAYKSFFSVDAMSLVKLQDVIESPALGYKTRKIGRTDNTGKS